MAEQLLFFTELISMPVYDLKGRRIGRVKDAALVPLVHPSRIDRILVGGEFSWLTLRYDQIRTISKSRLGTRLGTLSESDALALRRLITEMYGE